MSMNCVVCVKNQRTGFDLLCDDCRAKDRKDREDAAAQYLERKPMTEFEATVFERFVRNHEVGFHDHPVSLEGDSRIAITAAGHRLERKGLIVRHRAACWYLTERGKRLAETMQKQKETKR